MNNLEQLADAAIPKKDKMHMARVGQLKMIKSHQLKLQKKFQKYDFEQLASCSTYPREKIRLLALSYLKEEKNVLEAANILKISSAVVYDCLRRFNRNKLEGLKEKKLCKPIPKINSSKKEEFQNCDFKKLANKITNPKERRFLLTLAYLKEGKNTVEIADALKVSRTTIYGWIKKFNQNELEWLEEERSKSKFKIYNCQKEKFQEYDFEQLAKNATNENEKRRLLALAYLKEGKDIQEVADKLKVSTKSICDWIKKLNKDGLNGLKRANRILQ